MHPNLLSEVSGYVAFLLKDKLPKTLTFHTIDHTLQVVSGVKEIGLCSGLSEEELETVEIAAWFHDTGYLYEYAGHEEESIRIAVLFLAEKNFSSTRIKEVVGCIAATKYPQKPKNILEQVLCDADFFHFSLPDYPAIAGKLRTEWACCLNKIYADNEWNKENCRMLSQHKYHTEYGKRVLQELKDRNLQVIKSYCL